MLELDPQLLILCVYRQSEDVHSLLDVHVAGMYIRHCNCERSIDGMQVRAFSHLCHHVPITVPITISMCGTD